MIDFRRAALRISESSTCSETGESVTDWNSIAPEIQMALSRQALRYARSLVGAHAEILADRMERGDLPELSGPDALRLMAALLSEATARGLKQLQ